VRQHTDSKEFSRFIEVDKIGQGGAGRTISATAEERRALADRFGLQDIDELSAELTLRRVRGDAVRLDGALHAKVTQTCVVSLQPVPAVISEAIAVNFAEEQEEEAEEVEIAYDLDDAPEPIIHGRIDLGEAVAQQLALALDPYPRAPGAEIPANYVGEIDIAAGEVEKGGPGPDAPSGVNPFSVLGKLKR
jgi:uncharacterized metal-binding protein YceD (DUF177 family)